MLLEEEVAVSRRAALVHEPETTRTDEGRRYLRLAWAAVAMIPVGFVAAMVLGDWLITVQGYESGTTEVLPLSVVALAAIPALLVLVAPTIPAVLFGRRAFRLGLVEGRVPAVIGGVAGAGMVLLNLASLLVGRIG